jgi:hypothetical protein
MYTSARLCIQQNFVKGNSENLPDVKKVTEWCGPFTDASTGVKKKDYEQLIMPRTQAISVLPRSQIRRAFSLF